jgi:hypothetical protein
MRLRTIRLLILLALTLPIGACAAAAVAGAGAATGIYLTSRGANAVVDGSLPVVARRTEAVFTQLGIEVTERTVAGDSSKLELKGKTSDGRDVDAKLKRESASTTAVEVTVRKNPVVWDRDFARTIVERIVTAR